MSVPNYEDPAYYLNSAQVDNAYHLLTLPKWRRRQLLREEPNAPPGFIYKYLDFRLDHSLSVKKVRDLIVESKIWLSRPSGFNDPYDFVANVEMASDPVKRRRDFERSAKRFLRRNRDVAENLPRNHRRRIEALTSRSMQSSIQDPGRLQQAFLRARDRNGVSCFCESPRNLLMWAHYAAGHTGLCLQFDVVEDPGVLLLTHRVRYRQSLPTLHWPEDMKDVVDKVLLNKGDVWREERELRYISMTTVDADLAFNGAALTAIIIGARFPDNSKVRLAEILQERSSKGLKYPRIYRAEPLDKDYGIRITSEVI